MSPTLCVAPCTGNHSPNPDGVGGWLAFPFLNLVEPPPIHYD